MLAEWPPLTFTIVSWLRVRAGMSQQDLAAEAGMSVRSLRDIEQGRVDRPQRRSVEAIAAALHLSAPDRYRLHTALLAPRHIRNPPVQVHLLGPLTVRRGPEVIHPGPPGQQRLLALLALQAGAVISHEEIAEVLWGQEPPASSTNLIHAHVSRLRRLLHGDAQSRNGAQPGLGDGLTLTRAGRGYRIELDPRSSDLATFDDLVRLGSQAAKTGDLAAAEEFLGAALDCWRGQVLGGESQIIQHPAAVALAARRSTAALAYAETAESLGHHDRAVARLRRVAAVESLHEPLHAQLMLALAADGQQAAALHLYDALRRRLDTELGITPGAGLQAAYQRVLLKHVPVTADATTEAIGREITYGKGSASSVTAGSGPARHEYLPEETTGPQDTSVPPPTSAARRLFPVPPSHPGSDIDLRRITLLQAIATKGSMSTAASALEMSRTELTDTLSSLEQHLDVVLIERDSEDASLTEGGRELLQRGRHLLAEWEQTVAAARVAGRRVTREVRLGGGVGPLLYALSSALGAEHPSWQVKSVHYASSHDVLSRVSDGQIDLGLCATWPAGAALPVPAGMTTRVLVAFEPVFLACAHDHPLSTAASDSGSEHITPTGTRQAVKLADLAAYDWLSYTGSDDGEAEHIYAACAAAGFVPRERHNAHDTASAIALITGRTAISLAAPTSSDREIAIVALRDDPIGRGIHLAWRTDSYLHQYLDTVYRTALAAYHTLTSRNHTYPEWLARR